MRKMNLLMELFLLWGLMLMGSGCSMLGASNGEAAPGIVGTLGNGTLELSDAKAVAPYVAQALAASEDPNMQLGASVVSAFVASGDAAKAAPVEPESRIERLQTMSEQLKAERQAMAEENEALNALQQELDRGIVLDVPVAEPPATEQPATEQPTADPETETPATEQSTTELPTTTPAEQLGELLQNALVQKLVTELVATGKMDPAILSDPASAKDMAAILDNPLTKTMVLGYLQTGTLDPTPLLNEFEQTNEGQDELLSNPLVPQLLLGYAATGTVDPAILFDPANLNDLVAILSNPAARSIVDSYLSIGELDLSSLNAWNGAVKPETAEAS